MPTLAAVHFPGIFAVSIPVGHASRAMPWPPVRARCIAIALSLLSLAPLSATASPPPVRRAAIVAAADGKQRVPKPVPEQPRTKGEKPPSSSSSSSDESDDNDLMSSCLSTCLQGCVEGVFESMIEGLFSKKHPAPALVDSTASLPPSSLPDEIAPGPTDSSRAELPFEPRVWARYDVGYLRAFQPGDSVVLRRSASNADSARLESGRLPDGARVLVEETHIGAAGTMIRVHPVDEGGPSGWVHEKSLRETPSPWIPPPAEAAAQALAPAAGPGETSASADSARAPSRFHLPPGPPEKRARLERVYERRSSERWVVELDLGGATIDNPELAKEYSSGAFAAGAGYLRHVHSAWVVGAGAGYRGFSGTPKVEYVGVTETDAPEHSRFRLAYATVEFGQRHAWAGGPRFGYTAGPVVAYVHEDATVQVLDGASRAPLGSRQDALGRWAAGGGGSTWFAVGLPVPLEVGFRFRMFGLAWSGRHEKSLTSDYTNEGLLHLDFTVTFAHAGH